MSKVTSYNDTDHKKVSDKRPHHYFQCSAGHNTDSLHLLRNLAPNLLAHALIDVFLLRFSCGRLLKCSSADNPREFFNFTAPATLQNHHEAFTLTKPKTNKCTVQISALFVTHSALFATCCISEEVPSCFYSDTCSVIFGSRREKQTGKGAKRQESTGKWHKVVTEQLQVFSCFRNTLRYRTSRFFFPPV